MSTRAPLFVEQQRAVAVATLVFVVLNFGVASGMFLALDHRLRNGGAMRDVDLPVPTCRARQAKLAADAPLELPPASLPDVGHPMSQPLHRRA